jgi:hypothetical protein
MLLSFTHFTICFNPIGKNYNGIMPEDEGDQGFELPAICHPKSVNSGCFHTA